MRRSAIRILAVLVLSLLGAPLAMHVILHDLHHDHESGTQSYNPSPAHSDHEHPIISSNAPRVLALANAFSVSRGISNQTPVTLLRRPPGERNAIAFGALRLDDDVGPQSLLSTFLI